MDNGTIIGKKCFKIKSKNSKEFYLAKIIARKSERVGTDWEDLKEKMIVRLSITGDLYYSCGRGRPRAEAWGQVDMSLREMDKNQWIFPEDLIEILEIWKEHHLNDLQAGTKKQTELLKKITTKKLGYEEELKILKENGLEIDRGYKYGTAWLVKKVPENVLKRLEKLLTN